jgi:hypothetical protein
MGSLDIKKNQLRKKVGKIYDVFKKFNTTLGRGEVVFKFTIILPPVATINFKEVGKINDFGTFVYDEDGEMYVDEIQPYIIIPRFYIIYDEEMIENLEWSQKPDYMWLESKIKDKIIKNFKNFKIDVSHIGKAVWRTFEKTNLDDTSDLWNPNHRDGLLSEEYTEADITDEKRNRVKKLYNTFKTGVVTVDSENILDHKPTKYKYVLNSEYDLEIGHRSGKLIVFPDGLNDVVLKVYRMNDDGSVGDRLFAGNSNRQIMIYDYVTNEVFQKIKNLFKNFKIYFEP